MLQDMSGKDIADVVGTMRKQAEGRALRSRFPARAGLPKGKVATAADFDRLHEFGRNEAVINGLHGSEMGWGGFQSACRLAP